MVASNQVTTGLLPREGRGRGRREGLAVREGFSLARTDVVYEEDTDAHIECPGSFLRLHFKLTGHSEIRDDRCEFTPVEAGSVSIVLQPPDAPKRERVGHDTHERSVTLICNREFTASVLTSRCDQPTYIRDFLHNDLSQLTCESRPIHPQLNAIVEDILSPPVPDLLRSFMAEAKALELLCYSMHQLFKTVGPATIRERDRRRVKDLCTLINEDPGANIGMAELSRLVGWNETQMMACFHALTGSTISSYRHRVRMSQALRQLRETDVPVTEIAFDAGYEHPSNFSAAFKRAFGCTPREMRRQ